MHNQRKTIITRIPMFEQLGHWCTTSCSHL